MPEIPISVRRAAGRCLTVQAFHFIQPFVYVKGFDETGEPVVVRINAEEAERVRRPNLTCLARGNATPAAWDALTQPCLSEDAA